MYAGTWDIWKDISVSIDSEGYGRPEKVSFDAYNENGYLIEAIERYKARTGNYPGRVLADQIYRTETTGVIAKNMGYGCQDQSLGGRRRTPKQIRSGNTERRCARITRTGSKWNGISAGASAAMVWDVLLRNWRKHS